MSLKRVLMAIATIGLGMTLAASADAAPLLSVDYNGQFGNGTQPGFSGIAYTDIASATVGSYTVTSNATGTSAGGLSNTDYGYQLYGDFIKGADFTPNVDLTVTISGFDPNTTYSMTFYAWRTATGNPVTQNFYGFADRTTPLGSITWDSNVKPSETVTYSTTFDLTSDGSGQLSVTSLAQQSPYYNIISGFTVSAVPEPGAIATMGVIAAGVLGRRRRD